jgi:hypothetical protein
MDHERVNEFAAPSRWQRDLLDRLLSIEIEGFATLRDQASRAQTRIIDQDGSYEIRATGRHWAGPVRVPVEARAFDCDGVEILVLLHVVDGCLNEVEIVRADLQPPTSEFSLENLLVEKSRDYDLLQ